MDETQFDRWRPAIRWNAEYYLRRFPRIASAGGWAPGWNMAAFLHSTGWFCYRGMFGWAFLNFAAPFIWLFGLLAATGMLGPSGNLDAPVLVLAAAYVIAVFVLVPVFADSIYYRGLKKRHAHPAAAPRPPSVWTALGGIAFGAAWSVLIAAMTIPAYGDYTPRAKVSEAVLAASAARTGIIEFHAEHRRLPAENEAGRFRSDRPSRWVESVVYEPAERRIVVTLREIQAGKRFALHAEEHGGQLAWKCRTINLERKYLPYSCRE